MASHVHNQSPSSCQVVTSFLPYKIHEKFSMNLETPDCAHAMYWSFFDTFEMATPLYLRQTNIKNHPNFQLSNYYY